MQGEILIFLIVLLVGLAIFGNGAEEIVDAMQSGSPVYLLVGLVILLVGWRLIQSSTNRIT